MIRKIVVFPNDPLKAYFDKGELVDGYFNPGGLFGEVHVISLNYEDIEESKVRRMAGSALLKIHKVGKPRMLDILKGTQQARLLKIISEITPHVIRAYNSNLAGWVAVKIARKLGIPVVISLHADPSKDIRTHINKFCELKRWLIWSISKRFFEPYALARADRVICSYKFLRNYAFTFGAQDERTAVIYNRVDTERFANNNARSGEMPIKILCVGRIFRDKNPENIIRAVRDLNVQLTMIGDGEYVPRLKKLVKDLNIEDKISFIRAVPHSKIHEYYKKADIFASSNRYGGVSKPVMEAMASGLSMVVNKPLWEKEPELVGNSALVVEDTPLGYKKAFEQLINDADLRIRLGAEVRLKVSKVNGRKMEKMEKDLYQLLIRT